MKTGFKREQAASFKDHQLLAHICSCLFVCLLRLRLVVQLCRPVTSLTRPGPYGSQSDCRTGGSVTCLSFCCRLWEINSANTHTVLRCRAELGLLTSDSGSRQTASADGSESVFRRNMMLKLKTVFDESVEDFSH